VLAESTRPSSLLFCVVDRVALLPDLFQSRAVFARNASTVRSCEDAAQVLCSYCSYSICSRAKHSVCDVLTNYYDGGGPSTTTSPTLCVAVPRSKGCCCDS